MSICISCGKNHINIGTNVKIKQLGGLEGSFSNLEGSIVDYKEETSPSRGRIALYRIRVNREPLRSGMNIVWLSEEKFVTIEM